MTRLYLARRSRSQNFVANFVVSFVEGDGDFFTTETQRAQRRGVFFGRLRRGRGVLGALASRRPYLRQQRTAALHFAAQTPQCPPPSLRTAAESRPYHQRPQSVAAAINTITAVCPTKRID